MTAESSRERRARARVGLVLREKWHLDSLLGVGGMAAVYAATHRNGKRVAIKMLHPELSFDDEARVRFGREAYAANAIQHPGAVTVLDDDVAEDGSAYLVMDLLDGETVEARRERKGGSLAPNEVVWIADNILDILQAAHAKGVVHRDIKPDNVFVTDRGEVRVLDFGLARMRELSASEKVTASYGQILGTPAYLPPEQAGGNWSDIDETTDVWAVGAMMFTLLTGRYVHDARSLQEMIMAAVTRSAPKVATVCPGISEPLAAVVDKALSRDKKERHASAVEMQRALRAAVETLPNGSAMSLPPVPTASLEGVSDTARTVVHEVRTSPPAAAPPSSPPPPLPGDIAALGSIHTPSALLLGTRSTRPPAKSRLVPILAVITGVLAALLVALLFPRLRHARPIEPKPAEVAATTSTPTKEAVDAPPASSRSEGILIPGTTTIAANVTPTSTANARVTPPKPRASVDAAGTSAPVATSTPTAAPAVTEDPMDRRR